MHVADATSADVWIELEDGSLPLEPARRAGRRAPARDRRRAARARQVHRAGRPAPRLPPAAGVDVRRAARDPAHRQPRLAGHARPRRRPQVLGAGDPALQRAFERVVGRRRSHRPHRSGGVVGRRARCRLRAGQPAARRPAAGRRSSRRPTCRPRAGSPTRSTCASTGSRRAHRVDRDTRNNRLANHLDNHTELIDRDTAWTAKRAALEAVHAAGRSPGRELAYAAFRRREGQALRDFATWCVLAETHGAVWTDWPAELQHPRAARRHRFRRRARRRPRLPLLAAVAARRAARRHPVGGPPRRHDARHRPRPGRRCQRHRRRLVDDAGRAGPRHHRRRAAGRLRPDRPGLGTAPATSRPARRAGLRPAARS